MVCGNALQIIYPLSKLSLGSWLKFYAYKSVFLHNGVFCNGCITERSGCNSANASDNEVFFHHFSMTKHKSNKQIQCFWHFIIMIIMRGKLKSSKSIFWCVAKFAIGMYCSTKKSELYPKNLHPGICDIEQILICGFDLVKGTVAWDGFLA